MTRILSRERIRELPPELKRIYGERLGIKNCTQGESVGDYVARLRERNMQHTGSVDSTNYMPPPHKLKRFCETCRLYKPRDKAPSVKGWKCRECKAGH